MADEFLEHDLDTPSEQELAEAYGSRFLGVVDIGDRKIRTKISKVGMQPMEDRNTGRVKKRAVIFFENIDKALILNATNKLALESVLGKVPANWKGATVGVFVDPNIAFGGKRVGGIRLRVLLPAAAVAKPVAAAKPTPTSEWPEDQTDDPGFEFDLNDPVPDFSPTA